MSNDATIEYRLSLVENATDTLIKNTDQIQADLRAMQTSINQQFTNMQQDLHLIIEMYQAQKAVLDKIDTRLQAIEQRLSVNRNDNGEEETYDA